MQLRQLFDNATGTYSYLLWDSDTAEAVIIDPVIEQFGRDSRLIEELSLNLLDSIETHIHADHVTGGGLLRERFGCRIGVHKNSRAECADLWLDEGDQVCFGGHRLNVIHTPGHTNTDICYLADGVVFTGDTLLIRGSGRTDFQSGDPGTAYDSITQRLFTLADETMVYPGHDYQGFTVSSIGEEKRLNPRLSGKSRKDYIHIMDAMALPAPKRIDIALPGNMGCGL